MHPHPSLPSENGSFGVGTLQRYELFSFSPNILEKKLRNIIECKMDENKQKEEGEIYLTLNNSPTRGT